MVEAILYDQMSELDLRDALDIWEEGRIIGPRNTYESARYVFAGAFDRLFDFSDTASAAGLMITIAGIFVLRGAVSPGTMLKIGKVGAGIGLALGLAEAGLSLIALNGESTGAERVENLRSLGGGTAMAATAALPLLVSRWGQTGEAIQSVSRSGLTQRIYSLFVDIRTEYELMSGADDIVARQSAAGRLIGYVEDALLLLKRLRIGREDIVEYFEGILTEAREVLGSRNTVGVSERSIMPVVDGIEIFVSGAVSWLAGLWQSVSAGARQAALYSALLLMGVPCGGGTFSGGSNGPRSVEEILKLRLMHFDDIFRARITWAEVAALFSRVQELEVRLASLLEQGSSLKVLFWETRMEMKGLMDKEMLPTVDEWQNASGTLATIIRSILPNSVEYHDLMGNKGTMALYRDWLSRKVENLLAETITRRDEPIINGQDRYFDYDNRENVIETVAGRGRDLVHITITRERADIYILPTGEDGISLMWALRGINPREDATFGFRMLRDTEGSLYLGLIDGEEYVETMRTHSLIDEVFCWWRNINGRLQLHVLAGGYFRIEDDRIVISMNSLLVENEDRIGMIEGVKETV